MQQLMSADHASLAAFADATNANFIEPVALPTPNLDAAAVPMGAAPRWALDVLMGYPAASNPSGAQETWPCALGMTLLDPADPLYVALPAGARLEEWAGPEWFAPIGP